MRVRKFYDLKTHRGSDTAQVSCFPALFVLSCKIAPALTKLNQPRMGRPMVKSLKT
jgi:hypothetical protein